MTIKELRVVVFGTSNTGKTQLISRFLNHEFSPEYEPTIEERYTKEACVDGRYTSLKILDTQGLEHFRSMREIYINNADTFVLVYDTKVESSVNELDDLCRQITEVKSQNCPFIIVGTKSDQLSMSSPNYVLKMGERLANKVGRPHIITSAKEGKRVTDAFSLLVNTYQRYLAANRGSGNFDSESTMSISSIDGWLYTPSERVKATPQPTLKHSFLKLKKSMAQIKQAKSFRSIRKVVSSASFYKSQSRPRPSASTRTLRNPQDPAYRGANNRIAQQAQLDDNAVDPTIETVTQTQLESVPEFDDVDEDPIRQSKSHGVCSIM